MCGLPCERSRPQHCSTEGSSVSHAPIPPEAQEATQPSPCSIPQLCWQNLNSERRKEGSRPMGCSSQAWLVPGVWGPWVWCHCSLAQVTSACSCPILPGCSQLPLLQLRVIVLSLQVFSLVSLSPPRGSSSPPSTMQPEPSFYAENLIMPVPISQPSGGCSWREIHSSPCHLRPFSTDVNAIVFHWFLFYSLLPSSHTDLFSVPMQMAGLPHVAFAHRSPPLGAPPLPFLFVQILLILKSR